MTLSRDEIQLLLEEMQSLLDLAHNPCHVQRVLEQSEHCNVLQLRSPGRTRYLLISTEPFLTRLHFVTERPKQPPQPGAFTMLLRKWLEGAYLQSITQLNEDRIIRMDLRAVDPQWSPDDDSTAQRAPRLDISLILELTGRHPNVYLLQSDGCILARKHSRVLGHRDLQQGAPYLPPERPTAGEPSSSIRWKLDQLNATADQRNVRVASHYEQQQSQLLFEHIHKHLEQALRREIRTLKRRAKNIERDLGPIERAQEYKKWGELLQSAYGTVARGDSVARVPDYYTEGMPEIEIPLDPARSIQQNIARYFHQYRRYKDAESRVEQRLLDTLERLELAENYLNTLNAIEEFASLQALRTELRSHGLLRGPSQKKRTSNEDDQQRRALPYREFRSLSGLPIFVGRGARHNDQLTTAVARGRDIWLHARDWPGSHVLLRMEKDASPPSEDLLDAALLAAHFSKGTNDSMIDVTHTQAKYVRKPKGFPPGRVTVAAGSTLVVRRDPERLQRILDTEKR